MVLRGLSYCNEGVAIDALEIGIQNDVLMLRGLHLDQIRRDKVAREQLKERLMRLRRIPLREAERWNHQPASAISAMRSICEHLLRVSSPGGGRRRMVWSTSSTAISSFWDVSNTHQRRNHASVPYFIAANSPAD